MTSIRTEDRDGASAQGKTLDVLIIEDEALVALDIEEIIEAAGHRVVGIAPDGARAEFLAERSPPDLIVTDLQLRGAPSGDVVAARIVERTGARVLFVSSNIDSWPREKLDALEPVGLLRKPYQPHELSALVDRVAFAA